MRVILLGLPGAGKGTQGSRLAAQLGLAHVATGQMIREEIGSRTALGLMVQESMAQGFYLTDDQALALVRTRIDELTPGFILDGYPRTVRQAEALDEWLQDTPIDDVFWLDIDRQECVKRLAGRRVCARCGRNYHVEWIRPLQDGICDFDDSVLERRPEDERTVVERRMNIYMATTVPVVDYYRSKGLLRTIDARESAETVFESLLTALCGTR